MTNVEIRPLSAGDDLDAQRQLGERAFGLMTPAARDEWLRRNAPAVAAGRYFGVFDGGRQVGGAMYHDMRQWWSGRELPVAGIAAVKMAPEARGQGLGRAIMTEVLRETAARGYPLSALYPATMPIYRSLGWELAGGRYHAIVPSRSLRDLMPPDTALAGTVMSGEADAAGQWPAGAAPQPAGTSLRPAGPGDADEVRSVLGRVHQAARDCGPVTRDLESVRFWLDSSADAYRYLADDGFISYQWGPGNGGLSVDFMVAASAGTQRALLSLLAGHSSTADAIEIRTSPDSPLWWLLRERDARLAKRSMWMLRVVDAKAAIEARGFGAGVDGTVAVTLADAAVPENAGGWELSVGGGKGTLERAEPGPGALTLGARGLAALYGGTPVRTLRMAGLAAGGTPDDDALLSAAFAATTYMLDDF